MEGSNDIKITIDVQNMEAVRLYVESLQAEIKYLRAVVEILDPEMIFNPN